MKPQFTIKEKRLLQAKKELELDMIKDTIKTTVHIDKRLLYLAKVLANQNRADNIEPKSLAQVVNEALYLYINEKP
jgi:hypothetical protein